MNKQTNKLIEQIQSNVMNYREKNNNQITKDAEVQLQLQIQLPLSR